MRSRPALTYGVLFFLSGATGLIYELLWVRVLYQSFGSTIQSVTTVVAAYMGGLGLGAWALGRRVDRTPRPAALYGWLEIAIGIFGILSPLVLGLAHWVYIGTAGALALGGATSVALRFGLAALVLLIPGSSCSSWCRRRSWAGPCRSSRGHSWARIAGSSSRRWDVCTA